MDDEIRKLAMELAESSRRGEGARLEPRSVAVALSALRAYVEERSPFEADKSPDAFQVGLTEAEGLVGQTLATSRDPVIARAALDEAEKQRPHAKITLRPAPDKYQNRHDKIAIEAFEAEGLRSSSRLSSKLAKST